MTEQEKIKVLLQMGVGRTSLGNHEESKIISKALEKQIPKDVIFIHPLQKDDDGDYMCPSCETGTVYNAYGKKSLYCPNCGQALKWE